MRSLFFFSVFFPALNVFSQTYADFFTNERLRIEYYLTGNHNTTIISLGKLYKEPIWSGNRKNLIDTFYYGHYRIEVYDSTKTKLLYAKGFCTLYQEWQLSPEAKKMKRTFSQFINIPFPRNTVNIVFLERNKKNQFIALDTFTINPRDPNIYQEKPTVYPTVEYIKNGDPSEKVDIVVIAEGYKADQMDKFEKDAIRLSEALFAKEPFKQLRNSFNVTFIKSPSEEEGTDKPHLKNIQSWKKTIAETRFYTFYMDRYLSIPEYNLLGKILSNVAYDQIVVLVNTKTYGGGGIYNYYSVAVSDNIYADYVFIHEFGHAFGALADEYQNADDANADFYDLSVEPWEPNITTLVDFGKKWKFMVDKKTPIPTPAIVQTNKKGEITYTYENQIGAFEGAGYRDKGIYRPTLSCIMRDFNKLEFCPVCQYAIKQNILFQSSK